MYQRRGPAFAGLFFALSILYPVYVADLPRMALVQPAFKGGELVLRAPGMLALHLRLDVVEQATRARVWSDVVKAYDMGALAAQWFTDFLGQPARLVRFDPEQQRLADMKWTGGVAAETAFADAFPLLVANAGSLADVNARLAARGTQAITMQRFRPNLVISGLPSWDEDHVDEIVLQADEGPVRLKLVKPCARCSTRSSARCSGVRPPSTASPAVRRAPSAV